jgi:putative flippase GtrA
LKKDLVTFLKFGLAGLPAFVVAVPLNIVLIEWAHWPKPVAYLLVVFIQMTAGFLMNHYLVFRTTEERPLLPAYGKYVLSLGAIRLLDWCSYTALVELIHIRYVIAQIGCSVFFLLVKYISAKAIFR